MILNCTNLEKSFLEQPIIRNASFTIEDFDKAAIVGINGAGKTTLLKMIVGELPCDNGMVTFTREKTYGYLAQHQSLNSSYSIYDELLSIKKEVILLEETMRSLELQMKSASEEVLEQILKSYSEVTHQFELQNGYAYRSEVTGVLKGLGFEEEDFSKQVSTLSGGQKTRVALGRLLLQNPDLIILDEPTNHLDLNSIAWLETYLLNYKGAVIIVSHDRYFLDRITNKIIEIDLGRVTVFQGNYSAYSSKKEALRIAEWHAYLNQQKEITHQEAVIRKLKSFNREKSIRRAESREKMLDKIEVLEKPQEARTDMKLFLTPRYESGNDVLEVTGLAKSFGHLNLFSNLSFFCRKGEHIALIGNNGTGKTTILKIINNLIDADSGTIRLGSNVKIGYYDQEHHVLHPEKTLFAEISDDYPTLTNTEIRNTLAAFLFTGDDVLKRISDLSGGERGRVSLAKLMLSEANFLILDEPTNHLDIMSKEILESALNNYPGTVLYVSHDRYFINRTSTRILDLTEYGMEDYIGNYDYYIENKEQRIFTAAAAGSAVSAAPPKQSDTKSDWLQQKEELAIRRRLENDFQKAERDIEVLEQRIRKIEEEMTLPENCSNPAKLHELNSSLDQNNTALLALYQKWEQLSELLL